ncbi:hypothetical protein [Streptomyces sp. KS 21]|uniref:hypothetical protein n=1 Tax=Streptomyces sp. KS 21 TaxID=2485150 RepID=UPI0010630354|nr:hypothetical protein [Streptomyces sp. KS 21]TDU80559.1 hypothetical protein EDD91_7433 [Streptomyces sp. KS 21]
MADDLAADTIRRLEDVMASRSLPEHTTELLRVSLGQAKAAKSAGHDQEAITIAAQALQIAETSSTDR